MSDRWRRAAETTTRAQGSSSSLYFMVVGLTVIEIVWIVLTVLGLAEGGEEGRTLWLPALAGAVLVPVFGVWAVRRLARGVISRSGETIDEHDERHARTAALVERRKRTSGPGG